MQAEVEAFFRANASVVDPTHPEKRFYIAAPWVNNETEPRIQGLVATLIAHRYAHSMVTKVMGIPSLGVGLGHIVADRLGLPHISSRKDGKIPSSWKDPIITDPIESFTTEALPPIIIYRNGNLVGPGSHVLLIDDFMDDGSTAGETAEAFLRTGVKKVSVAVHVAKVFRGGVDALRQRGIDTFYVVGVTGMNGSSIEVA